MRKAIGTLAVFIITGFVWGQLPSDQSETDKLAAVASLFGPVIHDKPVDCATDKACSATNTVPSVNDIVDSAFAQSSQPINAGKTPKENTAASAAVAPTEEKTPVEAVAQPETITMPKQDKNAPRRQNEPVSAVAQKPAEVQTKATPKFDPNEFRPHVKWAFSSSTHFDIYTQKVAGKIGSANLPMIFETSYQTLRRFIPWMMSGRVRVFVYQSEEAYLQNEPEAKSWTRAMAYPFRGEIVVYDVPGRTQELKEVFTHELTHIFTQQFFDNRKQPTIQPPLWLDEGLAVLVEDQAYSGSNGGPWNRDYLTRFFVRDRQKQDRLFPARSGFQRRRPPTYWSSGYETGAIGRRRGRPIRLMNFEDFVKDNSLDAAESAQNTQNWYLQAYLMVRFLLNPSGGSSPSNRMQFERFTRLLAQGEPMRDPATGYLMKDKNGKQRYQKYDLPQALAHTYWYNSVTAYEDAFWQWLNKNM